MLKIRNWNFILFITILLAAGLNSPNAVNANPVILPELGDALAPAIDGNISSFETEWQGSVIFNTTINGYNTSIRVITDENNLYFAANLTYNSDYDYIPVNNTAYNTSTGLNLQGHDWAALQIDNNLDEQTYGTFESQDDVMVVNQYNTSFYDGKANGTSKTYIADVVAEGFNNGSATVANVSGTYDKVVYEFSKPHTGSDEAGADFNLDQKVLQFKLGFFFNKTSNVTLSNAVATEWYSLRINETGTGIALETVGNTTLALNLVNVPVDEFNAVETTLDLFGFDIGVNRSGIQIVEGAELQVIVVGNENDISDAEIAVLESYLALGGQALIFLSEDAPANSDKIAELFGFDYLSNRMYDQDRVNDTLLLESDDLSEMVFLDGPSLATDQTVASMEFTSGALNISSALNKTANPFILNQEYHMYNLFENELVYDSDDNQTIDDGEEYAEDLAVGVSIDLLKGGRVSLFAGTSLVSDEFLLAEDNLYYLMRMMPWNARLTNTLNITHTEIDTHIIKRGGSISVTVNVTDGFGNLTDAVITSTLIRVNSKIASIELTKNNDLYTGTIEDIDKFGSMTLKTVAFFEGYGFAEGEDQNLLVDDSLNLSNSLDDINFFMIVVFLLSVAIIVLVILRVRP